eukprot:gb/GECH01003585.1/.p1 GENE.gb/GECH01003585.1/~~gb/GECH01003585.1/.p1  ORF type:complete len:459 (+),score=127.30 gb/GECH01003585.1/:1-1377(+)
MSRQEHALDGCLRQVRYQNAARVRNDTVTLLRQHPSLFPKPATFTYDNGTSARMILLEGTIPIVFRGNRYNIPINIYIVTAYPYHPPMPFVRTVPNMFIKPKHRHVDTAGRCYLPYLNRWNPNGCNLAGLVQALSKTFSADPPVYSGNQQQQQQQPPQRNSPSPQNNNYQRPPSYGMPPNQNMAGRGYQQPPPYPGQQQSPSFGRGYQQPPNYGGYGGYGGYQSQPQPQPQGYGSGWQQPTPQQPSEQQIKCQIIQELTPKLHQKLNGIAKEQQSTFQEMGSELAQLEETAANTQESLKKAKSEEEQLSNDLNTLEEKKSSISEWLQDKEEDDIDVDKTIEPKDVISMQILEVKATNAVIDDLIYTLDQALRNKKIDSDEYLSYVREISREMFMNNALLKKIDGIMASKRGPSPQQGRGPGGPPQHAPYGGPPPSHYGPPRPNPSAYGHSPSPAFKGY